MKTVVVGARGMLGTELVEAFSASGETVGLDLPELDITDPARCLSMAWDLRPALVLNAAALTAVDYCETHEEEAILVNADGPGNLAAAAAAVGARLVHYSTDYVFEGCKPDPYLEADPVHPLGAYGRSKALGEERLLRSGADYQILRTAWLFGRNGRNFVSTILQAASAGKPLRVVSDQRGCPTYACDLASITRLIAERGGWGVYHVTNAGTCTWYELARHALECAGLRDAPIQPVATTDYPLPAPRPAISVLANARLAREGFPPLRHWQEAVREYVRDLQAAREAAGRRGKAPPEMLQE